MLHPDSELRVVSATLGYGVFATAPIPTGTITWVHDPLDRVLMPDEVARLDPEWVTLVERYSWVVDASGRRVLPWDFTRFMNHSCAPTCFGVDAEIEIATRDIQPGEQLTNDYASINVERPFRCHCGEPGCRGRICPDDFERFVDGWDAEIARAVARIPQVAQPLGDRERFDALASGRSLESLRARRYAPRSAAVRGV